MPQDSFIAAIVLGSFQTTGIVGQKTADGSIKVLSFISTLSSEFISKGRVYNLEKNDQLLEKHQRTSGRENQLQHRKVLCIGQLHGYSFCNQ